MKLFKKLLENYLGHLVRRFFKLHPDTRLITISGSVGKTSTKEALATIVSTNYDVRSSRGNLNATLSAPLEILGVDGPTNNRSPLDWLRVIRRAQKATRSLTAPNIIIQEIGIDQIGEMAFFAKYLQPSVALITAITPEHMEQFGDLDTVAREELLISKSALTTVYSLVDISKQHQSQISSPERISFGGPKSDFYLSSRNFSPKTGYHCQLHTPRGAIDATVRVFGEHSLRSIAGAAAAAYAIGMSNQDIARAISQITPVAGRMNPLLGKNDSLIIDDSYNASPAAVKSALESLYSLPIKHKIAVLGSMNELGTTSKKAHQAIGKLCDPSQLDLLVVVGDEAISHLAPIAQKSGCQVHTLKNAIEAGEFLADKLSLDTVILIKGSQGGIYLEEATKILLKNPADAEKLVRQSPQWLKIKQRFFDQ